MSGFSYDLEDYDDLEAGHLGWFHGVMDGERLMRSQQLQQTVSDTFIN